MTDFPVLPGSHCCVGCNQLTFRARPDELCPRCAYEAEHLIEQIELDGLNDDLMLLTRFEAYCRERDERKFLRDEQIRAEQIVNRGLVALPCLWPADDKTVPATRRPKQGLVGSRLFGDTRPLPFPERHSA